MPNAVSFTRGRRDAERRRRPARCRAPRSSSARAGCAAATTTPTSTTTSATRHTSVVGALRPRATSPRRRVRRAGADLTRQSTSIRRRGRRRATAATTTSSPRTRTSRRRGTARAGAAPGAPMTIAASGGDDAGERRARGRSPTPSRTSAAVGHAAEPDERELAERELAGPAGEHGERERDHRVEQHPAPRVTAATAGRGRRAGTARRAATKQPAERGSRRTHQHPLERRRDRAGSAARTTTRPLSASARPRAAAARPAARRARRRTGAASSSPRWSL